MENKKKSNCVERTSVGSDFLELFSSAQQSLGYWESLAKIDFTEEMLKRMDQLGVSKGGLATRIGVKPAQISRLSSGRNNFTLSMMVRIARALGCELRTKLHPYDSDCSWVKIERGSNHYSIDYSYTSFVKGEPDAVEADGFDEVDVLTPVKGVRV